MTPSTTLTPLITSALREASALRFQHETEPTPGDARHIQQAIQKACAVVRLQQEYRQTGFRALPLHDYLQGLASNAGVELPLDEAANPSTSAQMSPWIDLALQIEVAARHLELWVRAWVASIFQAPGLAMVRARAHSARARRGKVVPWSPDIAEDELETLLTAAEHAYTTPQMADLRQILAQLP